VITSTARNAEQPKKGLYEHVRPGGAIEELLVFSNALMACSKGLQTLNQPISDAVVAAYRMCDRQQVPEEKIQDKSQQLYNQVCACTATHTCVPISALNAIWRPFSARVVCS
jgi:hypothetical protein